MQTFAKTTNSASAYYQNFQNLDPNAMRYNKIAIIHGLDPFSTELELGDSIDAASHWMRAIWYMYLI